LPVGEMIITLYDVSCLIHLFIHGKLLNHRAKLSQGERVVLLSELPDLDPDDVDSECTKVRGAHVPLCWLMAEGSI